MNRTFTAVALAGSIALPALAAAQVQSAGSPAEGVEVQYRYSNPSQSQQILDVQAPEAAPASAEAAPGDAAPAVEGSVSNPTVLGLDEGAEPTETWLDAELVYTGVIPGERDSLPHISRTQARGASGTSNTLSWVGFQPLEGMTRVFLQTGRSAEYDVDTSPDGLTITLNLRDTRIDHSNFRRAVDASYFGRAVSRIDTSRDRDGTIHVAIALSRAADYAVTREGNYLYVDFVE
jgi:hypothetical protein